MTGTRYLCPMPDCQWHHDEPDMPPGTLPALLLRADLPRTPSDVSEHIAWLTEAAMDERVQRLDRIFREHLANDHTAVDYISEIVRLQRRLEALANGTTTTSKEQA